MCVVGAQSMLYALAAARYRAAMRGTGVGAAVAVGFLGSIVGPFAAGLLLSVGTSSTTVIGASVPVTIVAALAAWLAVRHAQANQVWQVQANPLRPARVNRAARRA
jgi:MFS transporter, AAHS family, 3-hydroxyphenylpropionic acid transporter